MQFRDLLTTGSRKYGRLSNDNYITLRYVIMPTSSTYHLNAIVADNFINLAI